MDKSEGLTKIVIIKNNVQTQYLWLVREITTTTTTTTKTHHNIKPPEANTATHAPPTSLSIQASIFKPPREVPFPLNFPPHSPAPMGSSTLYKVEWAKNWKNRELKFTKSIYFR